MLSVSDIPQLCVWCCVTGLDDVYSVLCMCFFFAIGLIVFSVCWWCFFDTWVMFHVMTCLSVRVVLISLFLLVHCFVLFAVFCGVSLIGSLRIPAPIWCIVCTLRASFLNVSRIFVVSCVCARCTLRGCYCDRMLCWVNSDGRLEISLRGHLFVLLWGMGLWLHLIYFLTFIACMYSACIYL